MLDNKELRLLVGRGLGMLVPGNNQIGNNLNQNN